MLSCRIRPVANNYYSYMNFFSFIDIIQQTILSQKNIFVVNLINKPKENNDAQHYKIA